MTIIAGFCAVIGSNQGFTAGVEAKVNFTSEKFDVGSHYDTTNKRWTPPAGHVILSVSLRRANVAAQFTSITIRKNGTTDIGWAYCQENANGQPGLFNLFAGDLANGTDYYEVYATSWNVAWTAQANVSWFTGIALM